MVDHARAGLTADRPVSADGSPDSAEIRAAGAVLWRERLPDREAPELALVHRSRYDDWSFPKGKLDPGEHVLETAVREVEEETGYRAVLRRRLPTIRYRVDGRPKRVDYWEAKVARVGPFTPNDEVDQIAWVSQEEAAERLSYDHDREVLEAFGSQRPGIDPLIVLRHASAGSRREWSDADELRPLDERGRRDAVRLAPLLSAYGRMRVLSSISARCLETVLPYALRSKRPVETFRNLTVGEADLDKLPLLLREAPAILCTHGEMVPELLAALCEGMGRELPMPGKAEFYVVTPRRRATDGPPSVERHTLP